MPPQAPSANGEDIRDIVDPAFLPNPLLILLWIFLGVVAVIALAALLWAFLRSRNKGPLPPPLPNDPRTLALAELQQIRGGMAALPPNETAERIEETLRTFLHRTFGVPANFATTEELFGHRQETGAPPPPPGMLAYEAPFTACDRIRFSRDPQTDINAALLAAEQALTTIPRQPDPPA